MDIASFVSDNKEQLVGIGIAIITGGACVLGAYLSRRREITLVTRTDPASPAVPVTASPPGSANLPLEVLAEIAAPRMSEVNVATSAPPCNPPPNPDAEREPQPLPVLSSATRELSPAPCNPPRVSRESLEARLGDLRSALRDLEQEKHPLLEPINAEIRRLETLAQQHGVNLRRLTPPLASPELNRLRRGLEQPNPDLAGLCRRILGREPLDVIAYLHALQQSSQLTRSLQDARATRVQIREQHLAEHQREILACEQELARISSDIFLPPT